MILYLGLDPSRWSSSEEIFHYPVIRTERLFSTELKRAMALWPRFTHVLFTSRTAVRIWGEVEPSGWERKELLAIGEGTAAELHARHLQPLIAKESTQEGMIALLRRLDLSLAFLFFPRSKSARSLLSDFLRAQNLPFFPLDLYGTKVQKREPLPRLADFTEIVFTSPSTVEAFLEIFGSFPNHCKLTSIGPITEKALRAFLDGAE